MKRIPVLLLTTIIFSFTLIGDDWVVLKSEKEGYKISFPGKPEEQSKHVPSEIGELKMNILLYQTPEGKSDDNLVYLFNYTDYPDTLMKNANAEKIKSILDGAINGGAKNVNGKLLSQKEISYNEYPGIEGRIDYLEGKYLIIIHCYLRKNRLFMLEVVLPTEKEDNPLLKKFMNSFAIL